MGRTLEQLETRLCLASAVIDAKGVLQVRGDENVDDVISVGFGPEGTRIDVHIDGLEDKFFATSKVKRVDIRGFGGHDELFIDDGTALFTLPARIDGGDGNDTIRGGANNDAIFGGKGNDFIEANDGTNTIDCGAGNDMAFGGLGRDVMYGQNGHDQLIGYAGKDVLYGGAHNDTIWGFEGNDLIDGGAGNDAVYAAGGNDTVIGGAGNDEIYGEEGNDAIFGVSGRDSLYGDDGNDTVWGGGSNTDDIIDGGDGKNLLPATAKVALRKIPKLLKQLKL